MQYKTTQNLNSKSVASYFSATYINRAAAKQSLLTSAVAVAMYQSSATHPSSSKANHDTILAWEEEKDYKDVEILPDPYSGEPSARWTKKPSYLEIANRVPTTSRNTSTATQRRSSRSQEANKGNHPRQRDRGHRNARQGTEGVRTRTHRGGSNPPATLSQHERGSPLTRTSVSVVRHSCDQDLLCVGEKFAMDHSSPYATVLELDDWVFVDDE